MTMPVRLNVRRVRLAVAKLTRVGPRGWWILLQAQASVLAAFAFVRNRPQGELIESLAARFTERDEDPVDFEAAEEAGLAIDRAARYGIGRPLCLVRSVALHHLLERRGIRGSRICVGVRMSGTGFEAHAWVELSGRIIGDDPAYVQKFSPFSGISEIPLARASSVAAARL
jgi:hypothetical protein